MQQMDPPPVLVSRRGPPRRRRDPAGSIGDLERALSNHEEATREEIERGVRAMYRGAVRLMRQVASEAWAAGGPEAEDRFRDRILQTLARDDAFRAVLGQVEERQQSMTLRLERIEVALRNLIRANREAVTRAEGSSDIAPRLDALAASVAGAADEQARQLQRMGAWVAQAVADTANQDGGLSAMRSELQAAMASVRRAVDGSVPSVERIEEAAARGAGRAAREEVSRVEAALGRLRGLEEALLAVQRMPEGAPSTRSRSAAAPGADERLRALQRRLAWASARLATAGGSGNGGPAS